MILTHNLIDRLRFPGRMDIDAELETQLLKQFGDEPYPHEYSEQDLYDQVRKYVMDYSREKEAATPPF